MRGSFNSSSGPSVPEPAPRRYQSRLLSLELPANWTIEEHSAERGPGQLLIRDADGLIELALHPLSCPARGEPAAHPYKAVDKLRHWLKSHPRVKIEREPMTLAGAGHLLATAEGKERVKAAAPRPWLKKWLRPHTLWRFWTAMNSHLLVNISCKGSPEAIEVLRPAVDALIVSLRLPSRPLLAGRPFSEAVVRIVRRQFPAQAVALADDGHLSFDSFRVNLLSLHRHYLDQPEHLPEQIRTTFDRLLRHREEPEAGRPTWQNVRERILPSLVAEKDLRRTLRLNGAIRPLANDVVVTYDITSQSTSSAPTPVSLDDCTRWGVDLDMLHERALENLTVRSTDLTMEGDRDDGLTILGFVASDPLNAVRMLLPDFHRRLREFLGNDFYVAIPNCDNLLAFTSDRPDILKRVRTQVVSRHQHLLNPLTPAFFVVTADGIAGE